ncbi:MAG: chaperone modulator CbpM [Gelidibacter sp.]
MNHKHLIPIATLCKHYKVKTAFLAGLNEYGLIEITTVKQSDCIHEDYLPNLEKMIRFHQDLHLNLEGIDTVFNLLERIEDLQSELHSVKNRLRIYEEQIKQKS